MRLFLINIIHTFKPTNNKMTTIKFLLLFATTTIALCQAQTPTYFQNQNFILPDSLLTTNNLRLEPSPEYGCMSGTWNKTHPFYKFASDISLKVISNQLPVRKYQVSNYVCSDQNLERNNTCKYWKICLTQQFPANAKLTYTIQLKVFESSGIQLASLTFYDASFNDLLVEDGQSNGGFSIETYYLPLPGGTGTASTYNLTSMFLQPWRDNNYFDVSLMLAPSSGPTSGSATPQDRFPVATVGSSDWVRPGHPQYEFVLFNFGWHSFANCITHAQLTGTGVHCLQFSVSTTRIEAHMSERTYLSTGMKIRKPYTSAGTELLNPIAWFWNGQKLAIANSRPTVYNWLQGESNWANPYEYSTLDIAYLKSLDKLFKHGLNDENAHEYFPNAVKVSNSQAKNGNNDQKTSTYFVINRLAHYCGGSPTQPAYIGTTEAITAVAFAFKKNKLCLVTSRDLGEDTARDRGNHWTSTKYHASVRGAECYAKYALGRDDLIVKAPRIQSALLILYDSTTGQIQVKLTFKTQKNPVTGERLNIALTPTPKCTTCFTNNNTLFRYEQINSATIPASNSSTESWVLSPQITFQGQTVIVSWIVPDPTLGRPMRLIYQPLTLDYFPQSTITNENTKPHLPTYQFTPLPSEPFSILI